MEAAKKVHFILSLSLSLSVSLTQLRFPIHLILYIYYIFCEWIYVIVHSNIIWQYATHRFIHIYVLYKRTSPPLSSIFSRTHIHTLSLSHTHTLSYTHILSHTHSHTYKFSIYIYFSEILSLSLSVPSVCNIAVY